VAMNDGAAAGRPAGGGGGGGGGQNTAQTDRTLIQDRNRWANILVSSTKDGASRSPAREPFFYGSETAHSVPYWSNVNE